MQRKVILLSGYIGSGKDCVADFLVFNKDYKKFSIADSLKIATAVKYNFKLSHCYTQEGKKLPYKLDDDTIVTIRDLLVIEGARARVINENVWINDCIKRIYKETEKNDKIVISDFRFPNEYNVFKNSFGPDNTKCARIIRDSVIPYNLESEHLLDNFIFDKQIHNNNSKEELYYNLRYGDFF